MNRIHFAVITAVFCVGCSSPQRANFRSLPTLPPDASSSKVPFQEASAVPPIEKDELEADASDQVIVKPHKTSVSTVQSSWKPTFKLKPYFKSKSSADPIDKEKKGGDKKKNGFAIAGFALSITGLIVLVAAFGAVEVTATTLTIGFLITAIGIILSGVGRKSEKKVFAIIGFWLGLSVFTLGIILGLLYLAYSSI